MDDTEANRRILEVQGAKWGMDVVSVASATEAIVAVVGGAPFDLAILDYQMPEIDGATLARQLRALAPELPLVLLSSVHEAPDLPPGLLAAALHKPIKPDLLHHTLLEALRVTPPALTPTETAPATHAEAPAWVARSRASESPEPDALQPLRLLVAEDNAVNRRVIELTLRRMGYACDFAHDGIEAVEAVARAAAGAPYAAVFMDLRMPGMDGLEATAAIRAAGHVQPRIVAMTADVTHEMREACVASGMDGFLGKPLDPEAVRDVLDLITAGASPDAAGDAPADPPDPAASGAAEPDAQASHGPDLPRWSDAGAFCAPVGGVRDPGPGPARGSAWRRGLCLSGPAGPGRPRPRALPEPSGRRGRLHRRGAGRAARRAPGRRLRDGGAGGAHHQNHRRASGRRSAGDPQPADAGRLRAGRARPRRGCVSGAPRARARRLRARDRRDGRGGLRRLGRGTGPRLRRGRVTTPARRRRAAQPGRRAVRRG